MTKKGNQIFGQEEIAPFPRENPGYAYETIVVVMASGDDQTLHWA